MKNILKLIIAIIICELAGALGSIFTTPSIPNWYAHLIKPQFSPPNWVFAPVWTSLFALMGIAAFFVWNKRSDRPGAKTALIFFVIQLALNVLWSFIFFGLHSPGAAFVEIVFLWLAILATIITFAKISKPAAWLLVPYILWVTFAGYLNFGIWQLNGKAAETSGISLPQGYTLDSYDVAEVTQTACKQSAECTTPMQYMLRSNCPYTSVCLNEKCTVVCPKYK